jgi:hypothetical protein
MQVRPTVTPAEVREAINLSRSKYFWLKFITANWYATLICAAVIGVDVNLILQGQTPKWGGSAGMLAVGAALMFYSWFRSHSKVSKSLQEASARIENLALDPDGLRIKLNSGTFTFIPWSSYNEWTEGKSIFLLTGKDGAAIIPVDESNRTAIRRLLSNQVN